MASDPGIQSVGERLRRLRLERGFSQRELSGPGISYAYISRIEAGTRRPSVKALRMLARKLQVSPEYLETGSDLQPRDELELRLVEAELHVRLDEDPTGAHETLAYVLEEALAAGNTVAATRARIGLGFAAARAGRDPEAVALLEAALAGQPLSARTRPDVYATLGRSYANLGRPNRAVELFERCLDELDSEAPDDITTLVRYTTYLSYALTDAGEFERAEALLTELAERALEVADPYTRVRLYWSLGRLATREGDPLTGLGHFRRAVALLEATEDNLHLARAHLSCAWALTKAGKARDATPHLELAEKLFGPQIERADLGWLRTEQARWALRLARQKEAIEHAKEAVAVLGTSDAGERGDAWWVLAEAHGSKDEVAEADAAFREAVKLLSEHRPVRDAAAACRAWAALLRRTGRDGEALDVLEKAAELAARGNAVRAAH